LVELEFESAWLEAVRFLDEADERVAQEHSPDHEALEDPVVRDAIAEFEKYFSDSGHRFGIPLASVGSDFQRTAWNRIAAIPPGDTLTYGALAEMLSTSPRAIGLACRTNPWPIVIPCHRVVGQKGLTGYAGRTRGRAIDAKRWLLDHEKSAR